jgi:hypothetical protein
MFPLPVASTIISDLCLIAVIAGLLAVVPLKPEIQPFHKAPSVLHHSLYRSRVSSTHGEPMDTLENLKCKDCTFTWVPSYKMR